MQDALSLDTLPDVLRPFEQPLADANSERLREYLERLRATLGELRRTGTDETWAIVTAWLRSHPVWNVIQQDPFIRRCNEKPRGYPGDAVMIDYIYGVSSLKSEIDALPPQAAVVHEFSTNAAAPRAVRYRREFAAKTVDEVAAVRGLGIRVVSIAAGHLREAELSDAAHAGTAEFIAIDQDAESLETIRGTMGGMKVSTLEGSVRQILTGKLRIPNADLVYALGLFDYLPQPVAKRLTELMLEAVRPGGVLLIPNFLPGIGDIGWMESFMDWKLVYRRDAEMLDLLGDWNQVARAEIHRDPDHNITFLKVYRQ
jgi:extracellular factor (EF) 3-hydroxypalmitic acid methyl ester biosynthesis protein